MKPHFRITPSELKTLIESAYAISEQKQKTSFSVHEIAQTVQEYGIESGDLEEAYHNLHTQKRQKTKQIGNIIFTVVFLICLTISFLHYFYPRKFEGNLNTTLTTEINFAGVPLDQTERFQILQQDEISAVLNFHHVLASHQIRWEIRDANQKLLATQSQNIIRNQNIQTVIASCPLSFASSVGDYHLNVFADNQLIESKKFQVEYGNVLTALHTQNEPHEKLTYCKSKDNNIFFQVNHTNLIHSGALEWRWFAPDGSTKKHTIYKVSAGVPWQFSDNFDTKNKEIGNYRVELFFRNTKIDERQFELIN